MRFNKATLLAFVLSVAMLPAARAMAQDDGALPREGLFLRDRNVSVEQRPRPEYDPLTWRLASFNVLPSITGTVEGNDNIFATDTNTTSDTIFRLAPAVFARSNWSRHALNLFANLNTDAYAAHHSEDTTDFLLGGDGRLDVSHEFGLAGGASYERDTEPRTSSASPAAAVRPVRYDVARAYGEGTWASNRIRLSGRLSVDDYSYDNGHSSTGAVVIQSDRDHTQWTEAGRAEYALVPDTSIFVQGTVNQRSYRNPQIGEAKRDSSGYTLTVGANFDLTHLVRGEAQVGYLYQDYDNAIYSKVSGLSFAGRIEWFPSQLTTVTFAGARTPEDAGIAGVGGYSATALSATIDHELLRNVILSAGLTYNKDEYQNYDRTDERWGENLGVRYLANRAVTIKAGYTHYNQDSSGALRGTNWDINRVYVSLTYAF